MGIYQGGNRAVGLSNGKYQDGIEGGKLEKGVAEIRDLIEMIRLFTKTLKLT